MPIQPTLKFTVHDIVRPRLFWKVDPLLQYIVAVVWFTQIGALFWLNGISNDTIEIRIQVISDILFIQVSTDGKAIRRIYKVLEQFK